ncbi:MAG TPA: hypothetical protein PLP01_17120 [Phycisphaerae bacterium]|nr:hypothetical protein [Phycisphaerae bacterium]
MFRCCVLTAAVLYCCGAAQAGQTFYVVPATGTTGGDGSQAKPWRTLAEVVDRGGIRKVKPGDTVLLGSGYHGHVTLSGDNADFVTIAAGKGQTPTLGRLEIASGSKWLVRGLTISPSCGDKPYKGDIVTIAEGGASSDLVIEDCFIYTELDSSGWNAAKWMAANNGIFMGRYGKNLTLRNNYVLNTRFGIALCAEDSLCEGNVITNFSADAIRVTRDGLTVRYNVIKNIYVNAADGDANHDDAIQCFLFNKGTGTVRRATIHANIIINREDDEQKLTNSLQAIGFFDGPLIDFTVTDNVVCVEMWHGVTLCDAENARIERNVAWSKWRSRLRPWIEVSGKAVNNTVKDNYACSFRLAQGTTAENNKASTAQVYEQALDRVHTMICKKFGKYHPVAGYARLGMSKGRNPEPKDTGKEPPPAAQGEADGKQPQ